MANCFHLVEFRILKPFPLGTDPGLEIETGLSKMFVVIKKVGQHVFAALPGCPFPGATQGEVSRRPPSWSRPRPSKGYPSAPFGGTFRREERGAFGALQTVFFLKGGFTRQRIFFEPWESTAQSSPVLSSPGPPSFLGPARKRTAGVSPLLLKWDKIERNFCAHGVLSSDFRSALRADHEKNLLNPNLRLKNHVR